MKNNGTEAWLEDVVGSPAEAATAGPRPRRSQVPTSSGNGPSEDDTPCPRPPASIDDLGLSETFVEDLVLKTLYVRGASSGDQLASALRIPFWAFDEALLLFQQKKLAQVPRSDGMGRRGYVFELTAEGRRRAREVVEATPYVGPAPIPIDRYHYWVDRQSVRKVRISPERVKAGLNHLVLDPGTIDVIGPAINSARSVFLYGEPGNGKTTISEAVVDIFGDSIYVPWAVYADGEVIQLYDPVIHQVVEEDGSAEAHEPIMHPAPGFDQRFLRVKRPMVMVGGELTLAQLELQYDARTGSYQAPPHMKANGGVFVIDDFGRQHVPPRDLLNRWMVPLDRGVDFLTFPSGRRVSIPFACVVMFATNLNPAELVEEAFLRRIRYKVRIGTPDRESYTEIFRRICRAKGISFRQDAVDWIYREYYDGMGIEPRSCHPGDLVADVFDLADYLAIEPVLSEKLLAHACHSYFMDLPSFVERRKGNAPDRRRSAPDGGGAP